MTPETDYTIPEFVPDLSRDDSIIVSMFILYKRDKSKCDTIISLSQLVTPCYISCNQLLQWQLQSAGVIELVSH